MIQYQFYPRSIRLTDEISKIIDAFKAVEHDIDSAQSTLSSNRVLEKVRPHLEQLGFKVEKGKQKTELIDVPVLFGKNNQVDKMFYADALSKNKNIVIEVEAGRATKNNQFLKDIFEACMMTEVEYLVLAVRNIYGKLEDFNIVSVFLETLYISNRIHLPLKGILLIGY